MANPRRLIAIEALKQGAALLEDYQEAVRLFRPSPAGVEHPAVHNAKYLWLEWAALHAGPIMEALTAFAALEEILDHTHITELIWWGDPGTWGLETDADQTGEVEGQWMGPDLATVLRVAAADFAAADEADEADDDAGTEVLRGE